MPISSAPRAAALWRVAIPPIVVHAGAGGAMLSITVLKPAVLTLHGGHAFVLHDPLGLAGERLLAHLYRALVEDDVPPASTCRWVLVQPPLERVWAAVATLDWRGTWRRASRRWRAYTARDASPGAATSRPARVAERATSPSAAASTDRLDVPRVLLVSESERADALSPDAAARLIVRAARHEWAVFAVTRQGPARGDLAGASAPASLRALPARGLVPPWRTHLVCRQGALEPLPLSASEPSPRADGKMPEPAVSGSPPPVGVAPGD
jgi:hypothetical protein